jgi:hypothetical protein
MVAGDSRRYLLAMLHPELERRFEDLLNAWRVYQGVPRAAGLLRELADARFALDQARTRMHELRSRLAPEADEVAIADTVTVCPHLDSPSFVTHGLCGCGTRIVPVLAVS